MRAWALLLFAMATSLAADLGSKTWAFDSVAHRPVLFERHVMIANPRYSPVPGHDPKIVIPGVLDFRLVLNRGAVFGVGANQRAFFFWFTSLAFAGALFFFARRTHALEPRLHIALGLAIGGGIGNLYDRVVFAAVRDFIHLLPGQFLPAGKSWPGGNTDLAPWVFNIADLALLVGMLWIVAELRMRRKAAAASQQSAAVFAEA
jgi:signal peptidase II